MPGSAGRGALNERARLERAFFLRMFDWAKAVCVCAVRINRRHAKRVIRVCFLLTWKEVDIFTFFIKEQVLVSEMSFLAQIGEGNRREKTNPQ